MSEINRFYNAGFLGVAVYNNFVGFGIEEILLMKQYPFTRNCISRGNIYKTRSRYEFIEDKLILDATTLIILASVDGLTLLDSFNELILPYSTITTLTENRIDRVNYFTNKALDYINTSPRVKKYLFQKL